MTRSIILLFVMVGILSCHAVPKNEMSRQVLSGQAGFTGNVMRITNFPSRYVMPRHLDIWLPPSYDHMLDKQYPVLYMQDGQNIFDPTQPITKIDWGIDETMTDLVKKGEIEEAIIVGVWSTSMRFEEYMPQKAVTQETRHKFKADFMHFSAAEMRADRYLKFLVDELKPYIDKTYRTLPGRDKTAVMGSSMGGLISAYALSEYPDVFGAAACISTHFPLGGGILTDYFSDKLPDPATHKIYWDYGTKTLDHNYEAYQKKMDAYGYISGYIEGKNWVSKKFPGHEHSERSWRARAAIPLKFLFGSDDGT